MPKIPAWQKRLTDGWKLFSSDLASLCAQQEVVLSEANPPNSAGVYAFVFDDVVQYVGEAKGSGGLQDRILRKHLSGDDSHTLQRQFKVRFPDRLERREFLRRHVKVKWIEIDDLDRVSAVERLAIWLFQPPWNIA